jgi:sugar phosphate isomerase/epimerase
MTPGTPTSRPGPIAVCMHGFATHTPDGLPRHDAGVDAWDDVFAEVRALGFSAMEIADTHLRPGDLDPGLRREITAAAAARNVELIALHVARRSVIEPGRAEDNLAYAHRSIEACADMGIGIFSTGLHRPLTDAQQRALWFWLEPGPADPDDPEVRALAAARLRELGKHAETLGMMTALEMYEDTYLGNTASAVRLLEEIGVSSVGLNPDIGNLVRLHRPMPDWRAEYAMALPYATYWHLKNYSRDESAGGHVATFPTTLELGVIDYRSVVRMALTAGYRGPFLMEQYGGDSLGVCATNRDYVAGLLDVYAPTPQEAR